ncbi:MAG: phosphopyruvate hydratase [Alphaproteobacteria bacterium]|nr:phosphopyruvate hydratase [Alphaproteobacteria bacterium]
MAKISHITSRRVWDSRGVPTVEADVWLDNGKMGRAIAPSGASRGTREALEYRDGGSALGGKDVTTALANINGPIATALIGIDVSAQAEIDAALLALDPSPLKDSLGGNAMIAASLATLHAAATEANLPLWRHVADHFGTTPSLPLPEIQIFGGGAHAGRRVDVQDFMIMVPGASSFDDAMAITREVYFAAGDIMASRGKIAGVADEGGWWPLFDSNEEALETLTLAIEKAGETPGENVVISLDIAASEFGANGTYRLALEDRELTSAQLIDMLGQWMERYPIASVEDPLAEDDTEGMTAITEKFGHHVQIIGDDYLVTNPALIDQAIAADATNAVLIKVNQIGTVTEAMTAFTTAKAAGWGTIVSARSGETEDSSISHLAVGLGAGQLKVGSFQRSERMVKWNECLRIQDELGRDHFVGGQPLVNTWWSEGR